MTDAHLTPAELAHALGVSARTVRRYCADYDAVFGTVQRAGEHGPRRIPPAAATHLAVAMQALAGGRVPSIRAALELIAQGVEVPTRPGLPELTSHLPEASETLALLRSMHAEQTGRAERLAHHLHLLHVEVRELRAELHQVRERDSERERVLLHRLNAPAAPAPRVQPSGWRGLLVRLLGLT